MRPQTTSSFGAALWMLQLPALGHYKKGLWDPSPGTALFAPTIHLPDITTCDQLSQAFPLRIYILHMIKDWRWQRPGNEASEGCVCLCEPPFHHNEEWGCMCVCMPVCVTMPTTVRREGACMCLCVLPCLPQWAVRVQSTIFYLRSPRTKRYCPPPTEQQPYNLLLIAWILDESVGRQHMAMRIQQYYLTP